jgi:hypothetical protein
MKHDRRAIQVLCYLLATGLLCGIPALRADTAAECRQEVQDYGIPPEQAADYIDGCILSRGGFPEPAAMPVDDAVVDAPADTEPMTDTGQVDGTYTGGFDGTY